MCFEFEYKMYFSERTGHVVFKLYPNNFGVFEEIFSILNN